MAGRHQSGWATPGDALSGETDPDPSPGGGGAPPDSGRERTALGEALLGRAGEIGQRVDEQFAKELRGNAYRTARLGAELIGRWLATGEAASDEDQATLAQQGEQAILEDAVLADVAKAYFAWRDLTVVVLKEEGGRIGVGGELLTMATDVVRLSCDASLVRLIKQFDATRRSLQVRLNEEQARLAHRALHDQLTGLPNRELLIDRLGQSVATLGRRASGAVVLYLDLDNFKAVNDRFGHAAGDAMLQAVAARLEGLARAGDTVARLGGDEFVVLAGDLTDPEVAARSLAERIHAAMREPVTVDDRQLHTSVSIGIALVAPDTDPDVCLAQADAAMYEAKRGGPARYEAYNRAIGADSRRTSQLVDELRIALARGQFAIHYQPLFTIRGDTVGMEALLRWCHPELGPVSPGEFIPLLERTREIVPVGRWVLHEAARQCREWQDGGHPHLTVSVNVSGQQLVDPGFAEDVRQALTLTGLDPSRLILEVTESALVTDLTRAQATMHEVRELGAHLALDDFGTGYSSLLYLKGLPIDRLKVDRSFVSGLGPSGVDQTVVAMVVDLAHKLGLQVVAEGVETKEEFQAVSAMGCDEVQGFLFGRPVPADAFAVGQRILTEI